MGLVFIINLKKLIDKYHKTKDDKYRVKIISIFLDFDFSPEELKLMNFNLMNDFDIFYSFIDFFAFQYNIDFKNIRYITNTELDFLDAVCYQNLELPYDPWSRFEIYTEIRKQRPIQDL
jgi:hypothetical protein